MSMFYCSLIFLNYFYFTKTVAFSFFPTDPKHAARLIKQSNYNRANHAAVCVAVRVALCACVRVCLCVTIDS